VYTLIVNKYVKITPIGGNAKNTSHNIEKITPIGANKKMM